MQEAERLPVASDFGRLLRQYRLAAGLSQEALAERARMSAFAISALERGHRRRPQLKTLALLVEALALDDERRTEFEVAARATQRLRAVTVGPWSADAEFEPAPNNLPRQVTPLIGRESDLEKISSLVREQRLVTLVGAGGVGKTRLAIQLGETLLGGSSDGVWLVELATFGETASPLQAIASALGLGDHGQRPLLDRVVQHLQAKQLLLILDNCEHLIEDAARVVDALVRDAPNIRVLATSREPLRVEAEHVYRLRPLAVPPAKTSSAEEARSYGAIALFAERAEAAHASFVLTDEIAPVVSEICSRLDGIPLAIELAAARTSVLSVSEIAEKLDQRFSVLTNGRRVSIPRQQTLRALVDWSYDLLTKSEQKLFRALGVFSGDFSLDSVAAVQGGTQDAVFELLASLVEKSLVHAETVHDKTRFRFHESVRAYAHEQLVAHDELEAMERAHAQAYLALAERLESEWDDTPDVAWRTYAEPELENWRAALRWTFACGNDLYLGRRLIVALRPVWFTLAAAEGLAWVRAGLDSCDDARPNRIRAWLELSAAHLAMVAQHYENAAVSAHGALADFSDLGEKKGTALARLFAAAARGMLGEAKETEPDLRAALEECRALGLRRAVAAALLYLGASELNGGDTDSARRFFGEALMLLKALGSSRPAAHVALNLAEIEFRGGNPGAALRLANEALEADSALNDPDAVAYDLCNLAAYEVVLGHWEAGVMHAHEALSVARERGLTSATAWAIQHLAAATALRPTSHGASAIDHIRSAARLVGFVDARIAEHGLQRDFTERSEHEKILTVARNALGAETEALIQEGRTWTEDRAIEESLRV